MNIFISQAYSYNPSVAYEKAKLYARYVVEKGHNPISPVLLYHHAYNNSAYMTIISNCFSLIRLCDQTWMFNYKPNTSPGMDCEGAYALTLPKPMLYVELTEAELEYYKNSFVENN
jgi:hypothetical protein